MKQDFRFNEQTCSTNTPKVHYQELWTLGQQEAVRRLSVKTRVEFKNTARYELIKDFSVRAERIAGNYARIYLELEKNGKPELKGRFYWTGLAAFASKQVMCALDYASTSKWRYTGAATPFFEITKMHLGEGNFWLFQDIFVWHWFYINYPEEFRSAVPKRNWNDYQCEFKTAFKELPWVDDALPKIKFRAETQPHVAGVDVRGQGGDVKGGKRRGDLQLGALMRMGGREKLWTSLPQIEKRWYYK
ncbi:hypothetical protein, partial [Pseudomonas sp. Marseille-Q5299]|uniref:DUF2515 family protein n=1 Tax=Pseudomonas sp. Marseille-Q5299 TaxID=2942201 RepID=UPI00207490D8